MSDQRPHAPPLATVSHGFTHFTLDLHIVAGVHPIGDGWWQPIDRLDDAGLPTLYTKAAAAILGRKQSLAA